MIRLNNFVLLFTLILCMTNIETGVAQIADKDRLSRAIEYFGGQKYHEALTEFQGLSKKYKLNSRFLAYMGVCYFKVQRYEDATKILDEVIPDMTPFPPQEQAVYNFSNAESHFLIAQMMEEEKSKKEYDIARSYFEKTLSVCNDEDKGDVYFRLGFCHFFCDSIDNATECFINAKEWYGKTIPPTEITVSRKKQTETMLRKLLVSHRTSGMDVRDKEARNNQDKDTHSESGNIDKDK